MTIEAAASNPFILPDYDEETYEALIEQLGALLAFTNEIRGTFSAKEDVDPVRHLLGTAVGWGGLPETEAMYLANVPNMPLGEYKIEVPAEVPVGAFWSVSLYARRSAPNGADAPAAPRKRRMSAKRKQELVLRLPRGEDLELVSRELGVRAADLSAWRNDFLAGPQRLCQHHSVAPVCLHLVPGLAWDQRRRHDLAAMSEPAQQAVHAVAARPRFLAEL